MGSTLCTADTHSADVDSSISTLHRNHVQGRDDARAYMGEGEVSYTRTYMVDKLLVFAPKDKVEGVTDPENRAVVIYVWSPTGH